MSPTMKNADTYCGSCFRTVPSGHDLCGQCASAEASAAWRPPLVLLGATGLAVGIVGALNLDLHLCVWGAALAAIAVLVHVGLVVVRVA
jgi:hypothetical protein